MLPLDPQNAALGPLDDAPVAAGVFDAALACLHANRALRELSGSGSGSASGRSLPQLLPHLAPELEPLLRRALIEGLPTTGMAGPYRARAWLQRGRGLVLWLEASELDEKPSPARLVEHVPAAAAVVSGPELRYLAANARWISLVGRAELLGRSAWTAHLHLAGQGLWTAVERARRRRERVEALEVPFRIDRNGDEPVEGVLELDCEPLEGQDAVRMVALDVTERVRSRRRAEHLAAELERTEDLLRVGAIEAGALVWTADEAGGLLSSPSWEAFTGLAPARLEGQGWLASVHPEDRRATERAWALAVRAGAPFVHQARFRRSDGAFVVLALQARPKLGDDGTMRGWLGTALDVTARLALDERALQLERASTDLASAVELGEVLDALARAAVPGLASAALVDAVEGTRLLAARAIASRGGRAMLEHLEGDASGGELARLARASGRPQRATEPPVFAGLGSDVPQSALAVPLCARGRCLAVLTLVDFSRRRFGDEVLRAAEELGRRAALALDHALLLREAQTAARVRDELLAGVSHELRTPLTAILGWSRLLRIKGKDPDALERGLAIIERNAQAQATLVDELIAASRAASGRLHLEPELLDPAAALASAVAAVRPAALARGVELAFSPPDAALAVQGDPVRLQQALWNVLSGAVRGASSGARLVAQARSDCGAVLLSVEDTLPASDARLPRGFDLSLQLAQRIAELHGGGLQLEDTGRVTLLLPAQPPPAPPVASLALASAVRLDGLAVLVVDEDADQRGALAELLAGRGAEVAVAASEREARGLLRTSLAAVVSALPELEAGFPELVAGEGPQLVTIRERVEPGALVGALAALAGKPARACVRARSRFG
ncbi:MAG: PAS domain-containing protein [Deltaproteobacteria bacterium]|nr:PAS domain-containing protein [Deltaproteobacteria bacterium]